MNPPSRSASATDRNLDRIRRYFARTTNAQSFRKNLKCCRQATRHFTVHFNLDALILIHRTRDNLRRQRVPDFRHAEMRAQIQTRRVCQNSGGAQIADADHVKLSIGQFCVRARSSSRRQNTARWQCRSLPPSCAAPDRRQVEPPRESARFLAAVCSMATPKETRPVNHFGPFVGSQSGPPSLTRAITSALMPNEATPRKYRDSGSPSSLVNVTLPTSIRRVWPSRRILAASLRRARECQWFCESRRRCRWAGFPILHRCRLTEFHSQLPKSCRRHRRR